MNSKKLRTIIPILVALVIGIGYMTTTGIGTVSAFGFGDISLLCPIGALEVLLASKMMLPRALISIVIVIILIILFGRAFCAWICPVPVVSKLREAFAGDKTKKLGQVDIEPKALTDEEKALLKGCQGKCADGKCKPIGKQIDERHFVLGGALLSALIFGFPVFCLICPVGLSFATILLLMLLFGGGDVTWSVVFVPVLLLVEVVFFRKWCSKICPISAFMSLFANGNKTFKVKVDESKCIETQGGTCGRCSQVCDQGINPRYPELGASWNECTKCRACLDVCPSKAISMPFLAKKGAEPQPIVIEAAAPEAEEAPKE